MIDYIDVHIVEHPFYPRRDKLEKLLYQLESEPVKVHVVKGTPNAIGPGRFLGFSQGTSPLQSYVDDDDEIVPGIFSKCLKIFASEDIDALCTEEIQRQEDGSQGIFGHPYKYYDRRHLFRLHHLAVFKREVIAPHIHKIKDFVDGSEHGLWAQLLINGAKVRHLPTPGYVWNLHKKDSKSLKLKKDPLFEQWGKQLYNMARRERFKTHLLENPILSPEDIEYVKSLEFH